MMVWISSHPRLAATSGSQRYISALQIGKTRNCSVSYLRPIHDLIPYENGWLASRLSFGFSPSHRAGLNSHGSEKLDAAMPAAKGLVDTTVYSLCQYSGHCNLRRDMERIGKDILLQARNGHQQLRRLVVQHAAAQMAKAGTCAWPLGPPL